MESILVKHKYATALGSVGFAAGISYAFYEKTGFWKGLGISIIGNIAGAAIGYAIDVSIAK